MNNLITSIDRELIFSLDLSYHTKCILLKIVADFIYGDETLDFLYLEENIFGVWPEKVILNALDELAEGGIMHIDICDCGECEIDESQIMFNSEFIDDVCPQSDCCECCGESVMSFNVNYN